MHARSDTPPMALAHRGFVIVEKNVQRLETMYIHTLSWVASTIHRFNRVKENSLEKVPGIVPPEAAILDLLRSQQNPNFPLEFHKPGVRNQIG